MAYDIYVDPITGGYKIENNKFVYVDVTINKINVYLSTPIGSYIYASSIGNPLLAKSGLLSISEITQDITTCLQPLIQSKEITNLVISNIQLTPTNRYIVALVVTLPNGKNPIITWIK